MIPSPGKVLTLAMILGASALFAAPDPDSTVPRIVVLGDPHLPYKTTKTWSPAAGEALVLAKEAVVRDINGWKGLTRIVAVGDLVGTRGTDEEYRFASAFLGRLTAAPFIPITGNHDYIYRDEAGGIDGLLPADAATRAEKLRRFMSYFHLSSLQREESLGGYELIYLSTDSTDPRYEVGLSEASLRWLDETLRLRPSLPTIIFYHAPLAGTLVRMGRPISTSSGWSAQPAADIDAILRRNPQVFLWVSGHTHTSPKDPSFASPQNLYEGRITDIHCSDLGHKRIYTNSLWLYPDRVVVRTFDHGAQKYLAGKERSIPVPTAVR